MILLLAAVNLGTLVLGRSIERAREMAVRTALGASRMRLVRQLVAEQAVLAAFGRVAGLLLARVALPLLVSRIPPEMPRQGDIALDAVVFVAVFAATVVVSIVLALVPVVIAARPELQPLLRQNQSTETPARTAGARRAGRRAGRAGHRARDWRRADAALALEPAARRSRVRGRDSVLTFRLQTTSKSDEPHRRAAVFRAGARARARAARRHQRRVDSASADDRLQLDGAGAVRIEAPPAPGATPPTAIWRFIGWDYFQTMGIPLRAGRMFTRRTRHAVAGGGDRQRGVRAQGVRQRVRRRSAAGSASA